MHRISIRCLVCATIMCTASLPAWAKIVLSQADETRLVLQQPAKRVITLSPHLTELVFAAGAGEHIIATVQYSLYPEDAAALPRIGDAFRLDLERILALNPDLIIAWHSGNPQQAVARLKSLGIPTWTVEIRQPDQIASTLEWIGLATGNTIKSQAAARQVRHKLASLSSQYADLPPVSYFYQVASHPLYTINGEHLISQSLALCGGVNIFQDASALAPHVTHEFVISSDPQALLAPSGPQQRDPLADWREWQGMQAITNQAMFLLPADEISRATPRMLDAVATACKFLHQLRGHDGRE